MSGNRGSKLPKKQYRSPARLFHSARLRLIIYMASSPIFMTGSPLCFAFIGDIIADVVDEVRVSQIQETPCFHAFYGGIHIYILPPFSSNNIIFNVPLIGLKNLTYKFSNFTNVLSPLKSIFHWLY